MKIFKKIIGLFLFVLTIGTANGQSKADETIKDWERAKAYTKEYLDAMSEGSYTLKPTPEMRSFADQMLHLSDTNFAFAASATGASIPVEMVGLEKSADKSKATVLKETLASYDFVINGLKKLSVAQVTEKVKLFGKFDLTKAQIFEKAFEHQTHQRGQMTVYLRLAGITPPAEKLF
jgi:uncharacterized damage-inducible protein DinB